MSKGIGKAYNWLSYDYVLKGMAEGWWIMLKNEGINTGEFRLDE